MKYFPHLIAILVTIVVLTVFWWCIEGEPRFAPSTAADYLGALATMGGTAVAILYVRTTNKTLRELQEQNKIISDPRLRVQISEHTVLPTREANLEPSADFGCGREIQKLQGDWGEQAALVRLPKIDPSPKKLYVHLVNHGHMDIEEVRFRVRITVHHQQPFRDRLSFSVSAESAYRVTEILEATHGSLYVLIGDINSFPAGEVELHSVSYKDGRYEQLRQDVPGGFPKKYTINHPELIPQPEESPVPEDVLEGEPEDPGP